MIRSFQICLIFVLLALSACVPESAKSNRKTSSSSSTSSGGGTTDPTFETSEEIYWYSGQKITGPITINQNSQTVIYLRGQSVHNFLEQNTGLNYCMAFKFNTTGAKEQLRARAIPISFHNFATNSIERVLRIDLPELASNSSTCTGTLTEIDGDGEAVPSSTVTTANSAFDLTTLCTTCSGVIAASSVSLYQIASNAIADTGFVPKQTFKLSSLDFRVDVQSTFTDPNSTCTTSQCKAQGFDCCVSGQCVNDGQEKPNASSQPDYAQALIDLANNPAAFFNYPNIFFACSSPPAPTSTPTPLPDPQAQAQVNFDQEVLDFKCLEEGKKESPDYAVGECSDVNQFSKSLCEAASEVWTPYCQVGICSDKSFYNEATCTAGSGTWTTVYDNTAKVNGEESAYTTIRSDVWDRCGCVSDPFPTDPLEPKCPDFGLMALLDSNENITQIICDVPQPLTEPTPIQNLNLAVPARSAPHRFFRSDTGNPVDDISTLTNVLPVIVPEGEEFSYLDEFGKTDPQNGSYNMNSIIGQMTVELNRALPAKMVPVEFDQTYILGATSGFHTPCPQCTSDSWLETFSANPVTSGGAGLQAVGFTTNRQTYSNNTSNGNYEDTVFGRACWLPPTMLPFSHKPSSTVATQRQNRTSAQAAMYINGYQREWFGFNKGALIGSFDGVRWFAIGKGRRVTATSTKLYLAINAPYADLSEPTDLIVQIVTDQTGIDTVPNFDYDPALAINDISQNTGATCQFFHQCNVDSDCVTKLGWEYTCADTSEYRSNWPKFDIFGDEEVNNEIPSATIGSILQGTIPGGTKKRCVYRGAGAPCKRNFTSGISTASKQKLFTCAPNFYCADLSDGAFNDEIVRTPNALEIFLFGQEANVLGRPLTYVNATKSLDSNIITNIEHNAKIFTSSSGDFGLCRPGKALVQTFLAQHQANDSTGRTDYISQISSCNSSATGDDRVYSCPIFETEEDTSTEIGDYIIDSVQVNKRHIQNSCGGESTRPLSGGGTTSSFDQIEIDPLVSIASLLQPAVTKDACFRRPGSVCHTDLDCSPNKLHADQAIFFGTSYFGGTDAELNYWQENLVCGQAKAKPLLQDTNFFDYDLTLNRCCREVGTEFTMYTQDDDNLIDDEADNTGLNVVAFPQNNPGVTGRYSRYSVAEAEDKAINSSGGIDRTVPHAQAPIFSPTTGTNPPKAFQWKTFNDSATKTCCGGGWVRKFADGGHDWSNKDRVNVVPELLKCLNYTNDLIVTNPPEVSKPNYNKDLEKLCTSPADMGCAQWAFADPSGFTFTNPSEGFTPGNGTMVLDTTPTEPPVDGAPIVQPMNIFVPYQPVPYLNLTPINSTYTDGPFNFLRNAGNYRGASFYLPIYIGGYQNIMDVKINYRKTDGSLHATQTVNPLTAAPGANTCGIPSNPTALAENTWCLQTNAGGAFSVFHIHGEEDAARDGDPDGDGFIAEWEFAGIQITFNVMGGPDYCNIGLPGVTAACIWGGVTEADSAPAVPRKDRNEFTVPGNDLYYLTKLARLELLGIPQIFYEPIYCNNNRTKLIGGIYKDETRSAFEANSETYSSNVNGVDLDSIYDGNPAKTADVSNAALDIVYQDKIVLNPVFSPHQFLCCAKLGEEVTTSTRCCSNFSSTGGTGSTQTCKLPTGANVSLYFNKFVSGDGVGDEQPGGGLKDEDFVPETGEPKLTNAVQAKIKALGDAYCDSEETRKGAAFGYYNGEPNSGFYQQEGDDADSVRYSIVDSPGDFDNDNDSGNTNFLNGFRWDHNFYCN